MSETQLTLTQPERDLLLELLKQTLGDSRVEVRRTEFSTDFRHHLQEREEVLKGLLEKVSQSEATV